jgi:hypothetical protein
MTTTATRRPRLAEVPLASVWPPQHPRCYATMSIGQWDSTLQAAYDLGYVLLELDDDERVLRAYRTTALNCGKPMTTPTAAFIAWWRQSRRESRRGAKRRPASALARRRPPRCLVVSKRSRNWHGAGAKGRTCTATTSATTTAAAFVPSCSAMGRLNKQDREWRLSSRPGKKEQLSSPIASRLTCASYVRPGAFPARPWHGVPV